MTEHGIVHRSSCVYIKQNGDTERKNRHLLEIDCTLFIHRKVPKYFRVIHFLQYVI